MRLGVAVKTFDHAEGIEVQSGLTFDGVTHWANTELIRLRDQAVREALIKLGWTPPAE